MVRILSKTFEKLILEFVNLLYTSCSNVLKDLMIIHTIQAHRLKKSLFLLLFPVLLLCDPLFLHQRKKERVRVIRVLTEYLDQITHAASNLVYAFCTNILNQIFPILSIHENAIYKPFLFIFCPRSKSFRFSYSLLISFS